MTYIPYDPLVPELTSDSLDESQPEFLNNFITLFDIFARNHKPIDDPLVPGNHTIIELKEQVTPIQTNVSEINIYNKNVDTSTNQVFLRYQGNGQEFAYTCYQIYGITPEYPNKGQFSYFTFLPGEILMYFGSFIPASKQSIYKLGLFPPIAKKIISIAADQSFTNSSTFFQKPLAYPIKNKDGYFDTVEFRRSTFDGDIPPCYYIVVVNLRAE